MKSQQALKQELKASLRLLKEKYLDKVSSDKYNSRLKECIEVYPSLSKIKDSSELESKLKKLQGKVEKLQMKLSKHAIPSS